MQAFLASDVVYSQRVAPLIKDALDKNDVKGQQIAGSRFMTGHLVAGAGHRGLAPGPQREQRLAPARPGRPRRACTATGW